MSLFQLVNNCEQDIKRTR